MSMASVADRLQMAEVLTALEDAIMGEIRIGPCVEVLEGSRRLGLQRVEEAAWGMAVGRFEEVCETAGFIAGAWTRRRWGGFWTRRMTG
jgi:hypothetical protein